MPILIQLTECYKLWHGFFVRLPKPARHTLGIKIDNLFTDCLKLSLTAGYAVRGEKINLVKELSVKLDELKLFFKILWELKMIDNSKYASISICLSNIGKMTGGWIKNLGNKYY